MSASLRKLRALVYEYKDGGTGGEIDSTYLLTVSGDADNAWCCARGMSSGRETTTGMRPEHRIDAVFNFAANVPVDIHSAIVLNNGTDLEEAYMVRAVLARDYGRDEVQVLAERVAELILTP